MTSDLDIYRAANLLIERHGGDAAFKAAQRADELLNRGDRDGEMLWLRILEAVEALQRSAPARNEQVH
jgi:triphosphoribosyl-dephospho-CoA synthetase